MSNFEIILDLYREAIEDQREPAARLLRGVIVGAYDLQATKAREAADLVTEAETQAACYRGLAGDALRALNVVMGDVHREEPRPERHLRIFTGVEMSGVVRGTGLVLGLDDEPRQIHYFED